MNIIIPHSINTSTTAGFIYNVLNTLETGCSLVYETYKCKQHMIHINIYFIFFITPLQKNKHSKAKKQNT